MPADPEDSVEIGGSTAGHGLGTESRMAGSGGSARPYLRLWFSCANQYARAYKLPCGTAYSGRCPSCGQAMRFAIGPGGTSQRFFQVSCR